MATESVAITDNNDNGYQIIGDTFYNDLLTAGTDIFSTVWCFLRFLSVDVPNGATVSSATVTVNITGVTGTPNTTIFGVDADDAAAFSDPGNLPSEATQTTASSDADPSGTGSHEIDVTTIVQEVINRAGWASGNAMAFVIEPTGSGDNFWEGEHLDAAGSNEAQLDITYTVASAGGGGRMLLLGVG